ncbi:hypothetical protein J7643_10070 [bacterium]|nr:hypothetical protein [bacterium]
MLSSRFKYLPLGLAVALTACTAARPGVPNLDAAQATGTASLALKPKVEASRYAQAILNPHTIASIQRLDVVPYLQVAPGTFWGLSATTGLATDSTDITKLLRASMASPSIDLDKTITLGNLRPNATYRIFAQAYDSKGVLISTNDASSSLTLSVGDAGTQTVESLPIKLVDVPFAANATVVLSNSGGSAYDHVVTDLAVVVSGSEVAIANTTTTHAYGLHPRTMSLSNLQGNTTYRIKASIRDAADTQVGTASVDLAVMNETAPTFNCPIPVPYLTSTFAGKSGTWGTLDGTGAAARFNAPGYVAVDATGNLFAADYGNSTIRKITPAGVVSTLAGTALATGSVDATGAAARFNRPYGIAIDAAGTLYVADTENHTIRKISPSGDVSTLAGQAGATGSVNANGSAARFYEPTDMAVDAAGNLYVADSSNHMIRKVTPAGDVTTVAGQAGVMGSANGVGTAATFYAPYGLAVDGSGTLYVTDANNLVRKITPAGDVTTIAGRAGVAGSANGVGTAATFNNPNAVRLDASGNLYLADSDNRTIRKITPNGVVTTLAGKVGVTSSVDGRGPEATFRFPFGLALDAWGNLYVTDSNSHCIRKLQ